MKHDVANRLPLPIDTYHTVFSISFVSNSMIIIRHQCVIKVPEIEFNLYFLYITG